MRLHLDSLRIAHPRLYASRPGDATDVARSRRGIECGFAHRDIKTGQYAVCDPPKPSLTVPPRE
jgi:hypothetical protein